MGDEQDMIEPWDCNYCGAVNLAQPTHCYRCSSPSEEFLEQQKLEREEQRLKETIAKNRSSRSRERSRERKEYAERKAAFIKRMDEDNSKAKDRPCMPQRIGEARNSR